MAWARRVPGAELAAALLMLANMLLIGIPGYCVVGPVDSLMGMLGVAPPRDTVMTTAFVTGMLMPFGLVLTVARYAKTHPDAPADALAAFALLGYVASGIVLAIIILSAVGADPSRTRSGMTATPIRAALSGSIRLGVQA